MSAEQKEKIDLMLNWVFRGAVIVIAFIGSFLFNKADSYFEKVNNISQDVQVLKSQVQDMRDEVKEIKRGR